MRLDRLAERDPHLRTDHLRTARHRRRRRRVRRRRLVGHRLAREVRHRVHRVVRFAQRLRVVARRVAHRDVLVAVRHPRVQRQLHLRRVAALERHRRHRGVRRLGPRHRETRRRRHAARVQRPVESQRQRAPVHRRARHRRRRVVGRRHGKRVPRVPVPLDRWLNSRRDVVTWGAAIAAAVFAALALRSGASAIEPAVLLALLGFFGAYSVVVMTHGMALFPGGVAGRAVTTLNTDLMGGATLAQWGAGRIIGLFPAGTRDGAADAYPECTTRIIDRRTGVTLWRSDPDIAPRYEVVAVDATVFYALETDLPLPGDVLSSHKETDDAWTAFHAAIEEPVGDDIIVLRDTTPAHAILASSDEDLYRTDAGSGS